MHGEAKSLCALCNKEIRENDEDVERFPGDGPLSPELVVHGRCANGRHCVVCDGYDGDDADAVPIAILRDSVSGNETWAHKQCVETIVSCHYCGKALGIERALLYGFRNESACLDCAKKDQRARYFEVTGVGLRVRKLGVLKVKEDGTQT